MSPTALADGTHEHHPIFWVNAELPVAPRGHGLMHIAFGMDNIDELMLGANIMEKCGWKKRSRRPVRRGYGLRHSR